MCVKEGPFVDGHTYVQGNAPVQETAAPGWWVITAPPYTGDVDGVLVVTTGQGVHSPDGEPTDAPVQNLLCLPPVVADGPDPVKPVMDSFDEPVQSTDPSIDRQVLVPCMAIEDGMDLDWQLANSPFYTVLRQRCYTLARFIDNQDGNVQQSASQTVTYGVSDTQSQTFSSSVGVTVGFTAGVGIFGNEATISASLAYNLGYSTSDSVTEMSQTTYTEPIVAAAGCCEAMYIETHTINVLRQDGTPASDTGPLTFRAMTALTYLSYPPETATSQLTERPVGLQKQGALMPALTMEIGTWL